MIVFIPISGKISGRLQKLNRSKMAATDARVNYMNEVLQAVKVIKAGAWEQPLYSEVDKVHTRWSILRFRVFFLYYFCFN